MGKYKVISGQNIFDVALHIYGSIEGLVDLMMSNPHLSLDTNLQSGDELIFTDDYVIDPELVSYNATHNIVPANGERRVYMKEPLRPVFMEIMVPSKINTVNLPISGWGEIEIDWGDNSPLEKISLADATRNWSHTFDNKISDSRRVRFYGNNDIGIIEVDFTGLRPDAIYLYRSIYAERVLLNSGSMPLDFLSLADGVYHIDLSGIKTSNLMPLLPCEDLMNLDLRDIRLTTDVIDSYFISLVEKYGDRRNCHIMLSYNPSGTYNQPPQDKDMNYIITTGMQAVWVLTNEREWNKAGPWKIEINDTIYTYTK